ncbi:MAG TPA: S41 family peptidase [Thermomicrobiales bacterium]|nr:S41 family peptidase [Thermomicrobiales bacterium]
MTHEQQTRPQQKPSGGAMPGFAGLGRGHIYLRLIFLSLLFLISGMAGGMVLERYVLSEAIDQSPVFPDLDAASRIINNNYYYRPTDDQDLRDLDHQMEQHAIIGALSSLGDQYTRYLSADQSATAQEDLQGRYGGTGLDLGLANGLVVVTNVIPDTPAEKSGIQRGDVVQQVDDRAVDPDDFEGTVRSLRGEIGATVRVSLARPSTGQQYRVDIKLEEIVVPPVTLRMIEGTSLGWIRITIFGDSTVSELDQALNTLAENGATGIILDLRGNGGGWVTSAQGVLGRFLDPDVGPALYEDTSPGRGGEEPLPVVLDEGARRTDLPVIVLVDGGTASAAEIVSGALKDYDRALVVGEQTYGKGSVQRIFSFSDGSTLRVTVAEWFTPSKGRIQEEGIRPNVEIPTGENTPVDQDPVLDAAVKLLGQGVSQPTDLVTPPSPEASPQGG